MSVARAIKRLRYELADQRGKRWPDDLFVEWLYDGLVQFFELRPDLFQTTSLVKLKAGDVQTPCNCGKLYMVEAFTDKDGNILKRPALTSDATKFFAPFERCAPGGAVVGNPATRVPDSVNIDRGINGGRFTVEPPVGADADIYARIVCAQPPAPLTLDGELCVSTAIYPALMHYVKAMAYSTERESATSKAWYDTHMSAYMNLLGLNKKAHKEFNAGGKNAMPATA